MKPIVLFIELKISAKNKYICEVTEKLYNNGIPVCIYAPDASAQIDGLLWTWKQDSFIPHRLARESGQSDYEPVVICNKTENLYKAQAIILHQPMPFDLLAGYNLIIDFAEVYHHERIEASRKRYKKLRDSENFDVYFTQLGALLARESISLNFTP